MENSASDGILGCGSDQTSEITLNIQTTTGGNFFITVEDKNSVEQLKKIVSKKLKVSKDRICLLHRERQLRDGTLKDNGLVEGSRVILLPSVETGLLTQRPENSVMQALESLNDSQVNDFLSGKSPLNLTMRLGDHMMLIQLQLSTLNPGNSDSSAASGSKLRTASSSARIRSSSTAASSSKEKKSPRESSPKTMTSNDHAVIKEQCPSSRTDNTTLFSPTSTQSSKKNDDLKSFLRKQDIKTLQNAFEIFRSLANVQEGETPSDKSITTLSTEKSDTKEFSTSDLLCDEQSPIKSLSNLVSSPIKPEGTSAITNIVSESFDRTTPTTYVTLPSSCGNLVDNIIEKHSHTQSAQIPAISEQATVAAPRYVPLPSSLKNNLIENLVGGKNDSVGGVICTESLLTDPIAANLTSCLCSLNSDYSCSSSCHIASSSDSRLNSDQCEIYPDFHNDPSEIYPSDESCSNPKVEDETGNKTSPSEPMALTKENLKKFEAISDEIEKKKNPNNRLHCLLHGTSKLVNPIAQGKQKALVHSAVNRSIKKKAQHISSENKRCSAKSPLIKPATFTYSKNTIKLEPIQFTSPSDIIKKPQPLQVQKLPAGNKLNQVQAGTSDTVTDTKALIEASKNLTQTLKKLSKEVLTNKVDLGDEGSTRAKIGHGAVIESMKHHGKGIYSGTFSGTLNPALQDRFGRPKRDISTIIHILNDLLCATPPQYRRGARITFEPTHNTNSSRNKQRESRQEPEATCFDEQGERKECSCNKCSNSACPYGECNGHPSQADTNRNCLCRETCQCGKIRKKCTGCADSNVDDKLKSTSNKNCKKCILASALALENSKTKCKLDQLRLVMQQKKQKREERKMKAAPYVTSSSSVNALQTENAAGSVMGEEIDTLA